ncbi:pfkB family carbohydrate kinase [Halanaerobium saccharolyticum]|uniref:PfkB family carbohydrate kinase n=1 Tax=Halanaerobium saccharolyticum TaxID=43595 RepID=A0A4R7YY18_9FIRM|nr:pfkB family carbohydrate kinase [Halanaerobium saccharolyticum]TDW03036.1 pfkB family carbohydrate kinase [Halanaerobium saccharolyticum]TDX59332.1 pfkB family carbohydrate kinase [Halanaerobium saccharolyticum]
MKVSLTCYFPRLKRKAVGTRAAGDVFAGSFAASFVRERNLKSAIEFAIKAAAYSVTIKGAQSSIPGQKDLDQFLKERIK